MLSRNPRFWWRLNYLSRPGKRADKTEKTLTDTETARSGPVHLSFDRDLTLPGRTSRGILSVVQYQRSRRTVRPDHCWPRCRWSTQTMHGPQKLRYGAGGTA